MMNNDKATKKKMDLIIREGTVVFKDHVDVLDIGISDGKILQLGTGLEGSSTAIVDASGLTVMAGMIDAHVHLNEPGLGEWEGFNTGSAALAAGGCTTYLDMPLNGIPPTVTTAALQEKMAAAQGNSHIDYALWGGLVPGKLDQIVPLHEAGVIGFKAFMSYTGDPSEEAFREVDDYTLLEGMKRIASTGKVLALHAESEPLVSRLTEQQRRAGRVTAADYSASRPIVAELEAIHRALFYAEQTGCAIHFVHVSNEAGISAVAAARMKGLNVTAETCPHYLVLTERAMEVKGAYAKCAPPLRHAVEQEKLWRAVEAGDVDLIASDHSPCPEHLKRGANFFDSWGGIAGGQSSMELMITKGYVERGIPLPLISRLLSYGPAERFGLLPAKGEIKIGADADLAILDLNSSYTLQQDDLFQRHKHSPYIGESMHCRVMSVYVRGHKVYDCQAGLNRDLLGQWVPYVQA